MSFKALILDLDGTLVDSKKDIAVATNATIQHMGGIPIAHERIYEFVGHGVRDLIKGALQNVAGASPVEALRFFNEFYMQHCLDETRFFPGVEKTLRHFHQRGIKLAVLTNKPQIFADKIIQGLGIADLLVVNHGAESGFPNKPALQTTQHVLSFLETDPEDTIVVGDSDVDLAVAEKADMRCALMFYGFTPREVLQGFSGRAHLFEEFAELYTLA